MVKLGLPFALGLNKLGERGEKARSKAPLASFKALLVAISPL
jgi:hypothetical protein